MRQSAELENVMTSVERVIEYKNIARETAFESPDARKPLSEWPKQGTIKFDNFSLSYSPDMDVKILKNLNFVIESGERVGIVGRTGAGKSSIINALFRLSYQEGDIFIDDLNTSKIGLHDLRSKLSIIPQTPVLFSGSMRYNLDPHDQFSDEQIWQALEDVQLKDSIAKFSEGLSVQVTEGGSNYSIGEKQLICFARAILRRNKIILMDEATSNVDIETDQLIQKTIREKFQGCTVLTIAHRLGTVMDYDKILVMDDGECVEYANPLELLSNEHGNFYKMVNSENDSIQI